MPRPRAFDRALHKHRSRIDRITGRLEQPRRIATRYDRLPADYRAGRYRAPLGFWPCE